MMGLRSRTSVSWGAALSSRIFSATFVVCALMAFLTSLDDGFVAEGFSIGVFSRVGFSDGKLPNGEPDKVNPDISLMGFECMADFCFARFQFQSHVLEP